MGNSQKVNLDESYQKIQTEKFHFEIEDMDIEKRIPGHMISPNSICKLLWNFLILILAIYTAIVLPIRLAFMDESNIGQAM